MPDLKTVNGVNRVQMIARMTRDFDLKYLPSGSAVAEVGVAHTEVYKDKNDEWKEDTHFFDIVIWGPHAESAAKQCVKGNLVWIEGKLRQETWTDKKSGQKRSKVKINAHRVASFQWNNEKVKEGAYRKDGDAPDDYEPDVGDQDDIPF